MKLKLTAQYLLRSGFNRVILFAMIGLLLEGAVLLITKSYWQTDSSRKVSPPAPMASVTKIQSSDPVVKTSESQNYVTNDAPVGAVKFELFASTDPVSIAVISEANWRELAAAAPLDDTGHYALADGTVCGQASSARLKESLRLSRISYGAKRNGFSLELPPVNEEE